MRRHEDGFTLLEIMAVVMLIGILTLIAIASFTNSSRAASHIACLHNQRILNDAVTMYRLDHDGAIPTDFDELKPYARDVNKVRKCPADGTPLVLNTTTGEVTCPNHPND